MSSGAVLAIAALVLGWSLLSTRLESWGLSGPMVFVVAGIILGNDHLAAIDVDLEAATVHVLAELTLALVLFADASRVGYGRLRRDAGWATRLLVVGLPLSFLLGTMVGAWLLPGLPITMVALCSASLVATDASLSAGVLADTRFPERMRRALNAESGLNDGLATPVVLVLIAASATALGVTGDEVIVAHEVPGALKELAIGVTAGAVIGLVGAYLVVLARRHDWSNRDGYRLAVLALAVLAFVATVALHGNGFIGAFVAGLLFGGSSQLAADESELIELPDAVGELLAWVIWFVFGAALVVPVLEYVDWRVVAYAVASLTVVRVLPALVALIASGADRAERWLMGWFGPRGLASVIFALLIIEELPVDRPEVRLVTSVIGVTVLASIVLHGVSASPMAARYARRHAEAHG